MSTVHSNKFVLFSCILQIFQVLSDAIMDYIFTEYIVINKRTCCFNILCNVWQSPKSAEFTQFHTCPTCLSHVACVIRRPVR